jgi:hypothetical protein
MSLERSVSFAFAVESTSLTYDSKAMVDWGAPAKSSEAVLRAVFADLFI